MAGSRPLPYPLSILSGTLLGFQVMNSHYNLPICLTLHLYHKGNFADHAPYGRGVFQGDRFVHFCQAETP